MKNNIRYLVSKRNNEKVLFVSDIHAPFQDNRAVRAIISFGKWLKPDRIIFIGDVIDFYAVSKFNKDPIRALRLQSEIDEAHSILRIFRKEFPTVEMIYIEGNHEARLRGYLWSQASELSGLRNMRLESLMGLDTLNIKYVSNGRMKFRNFVIKHGDIVRLHSAYTARAELTTTGISGLSGHTHRLSTHYLSNEGGDYVWYEIGCLCKMNQEYMKGKFPNWQQGFAFGFFKKGSAKYNIHLVNIVNGKALFMENEFSGSNKQ